MQKKDLMAEVMAPVERAERRREQLGDPQETLEKNLTDQVRPLMEQ